MRERDSFIEAVIDTLYLNRDLLEKGVSEYGLIEFLQKPSIGLLEKNCLKQTHSMFAVHFLLFHCLYQLQDIYRRELVGELEIHALKIKLVRKVEPSNNTDTVLDSRSDLREADKLAQYYLDLENLNVTEDDVEKMLEGFWQRFAGLPCTFDEQSIEEALHTLALKRDIDFSELQLKRSYKKALLTAHPDKGGSQQKAQSVIRAYQLLQRYYSFK
ncbi:DNA-J related domain-containing protein [Alteromonas gracilis]|uniref:DNA-J related domain-containing protein n=1 Tax=Alteromonas gracilis TaxID=1479524 RepID=UPI003734C8B1